MHAGAIALDHDARQPSEELVASVRVAGVVSPVVARRSDTGLRLISGTRRLAAARTAGLAVIPAVIVDADDERAVVDRLLENLHRADLHPVAQATTFADAMRCARSS